MIPYGKQSISEEDIQAVVDVLRSDYLTQGPKVPLFEQAIADYAGAAHTVVTNSATSALHLACLSLGLGKGDWLWTSPITFVASANCARYCGARVDFVDIDRKSYNLSVKALEEKLQQAARENRLPKVVVPVHLCGQPCEMDAIYRLSKKYNFKVIEDASHAVGGRYKGEPIGNCRYSDITIFSFHPVKIITTAEGGAALTNDSKLADKMALLRSHGITRDPKLMTHTPDGDWYYQQIELGFNYRMTELQAALGLSQLSQLDQFVGRRHELSRRYDELLYDLPVVTPYQMEDGYSGRHLYVIQLQQARLQRSRGEIFRALRESGIGVNIHYIPVHLQPYYKNFGYSSGDYPNAERYYNDALSLPLYPGLSADDQDRVVEVLSKLLAA